MKAQCPRGVRAAGVRAAGVRAAGVRPAPDAGVMCRARWLPGIGSSHWVARRRLAGHGWGGLLCLCPGVEWCGVGVGDPDEVDGDGDGLGDGDGDGLGDGDGVGRGCRPGDDVRGLGADVPEAPDPGVAWLVPPGCRGCLAGVRVCRTGLGVAAGGPNRLNGVRGPPARPMATMIREPIRSTLPPAPSSTSSRRRWPVGSAKTGTADACTGSGRLRSPGTPCSDALPCSDAVPRGGGWLTRVDCRTAALAARSG